MSIAIFGGTFDPIHNAHLTVAREAADVFALERVLFVPAAHPPHKPGLVSESFEHRYRMVELACAHDLRFEPSRIEEGAGASYSILTLERLRPRYPDPYFLIGADAFADLEKWKRWRDVVALARFIVVTRPGHDYTTPEGARVERLDTLALADSSSEIRRKLAAGEMPLELPPAVSHYIAAHGLYQWPALAPVRGAAPSR